MERGANRHRENDSRRGDDSRHHKRRHRDQPSRHHDNDDDDTNRHSKKSKHKHARHRNDSDIRYDPNIRIKQERDADNFERQERERAAHDANRRQNRRQRDRDGGDHGLNTETKPSTQDVEVKTEPEEKQKPNFELSGKLTEDTNTFRGVVIKYNEPPEAMIPKRRWRLYPFKGDISLPVLHIHRQSAYLMGRDRKIADIPVDHPSCSKQQAVLQFRAVNFTRDNGSTGRRVRPYIIDLESANGTFLNGEKIEARRYFELREKDVLKFGFSTREYVILHDNVDTSEVNDGGADSS